MKFVTVSVPDENCKGCSYHSTSYKGTHFYCEEKHYCDIFKCELPNYPQKCVACQMLACRQEGGELSGN